MRKAILATVGILISTVVGLVVAEGLLRLKNSSMNNYDIEMWRYAKELKKRSDNPLLGHEHLRSKSAVLQSVKIRLNEWGLRGGPVPLSNPGRRRLLFLGSSILLGWGVPEEQTVTARLRAMFASRGEEVEVLNGGVGNYNAVRYVERFLTHLAATQPTDIVILYFLRDAEELDPGRNNILLRHSQLAATLWILGARYFGLAGTDTLEEHYRSIYQPDAVGFKRMEQALDKLSKYAQSHGIRIYLAMTPDVHDLTHYKFEFIHAIMRDVAARHGYIYVDLLPAMRGLTPAQVWCMPGDPHPNGLGHQRMAEAIFPVIADHRAF